MRTQDGKNDILVTECRSCRKDWQLCFDLLPPCADIVISDEKAKPSAISAEARCSMNFKN